MPHDSNPEQIIAPYEMSPAMNLGGLTAELPNGFILSLSSIRINSTSRNYTSVAAVYDSSTGEKLFERDLNDDIRMMKVLSNSEIAAVNETNQVLVINIENKISFTVSDTNNKILFLDTTSKNQLLTLHDDFILRIWDIKNRQCITTCPIPNTWVREMILLKDRFVITLHEDKQLVVSDLTQGSHSVLADNAHYYYTTTPNGKLVSSHTGAEGEKLRVWDIESKKCLQVCNAPSQIWGLTALSDDLVVSGHWDKPNTICLWNINTGRCLQTKETNATAFHLKKLPNSPYFIAYHYTARYTWHSYIQLWELAANNTISCINHFPQGPERDNHTFWNAEVYPNGRILSHQDTKRGEQFVEFKELDNEKLIFLKTTLPKILPHTISQLVCDYYSSSNQNLTLFNNHLNKRPHQEIEEIVSQSPTL